ncbi:NAD(P)H-dependent oxidoreductase [Acidaminobacter sp. JC074]|uniref:NAD(P)H-dependent oxidoreductase n=1 Tax=Acidaminobacter sp. JC074 TaxID=2530199 RepID=UPI001F10F0FB|nr:NAD(P)H-dependent oxidoreductase [Acidaminobacter sp. JC074]MCH4886899.1 NAD(P)H-dependent oxidoreductase [Acidaminobacter sp. JC074]
MKIMVVTAHPNYAESRVNRRWIEELEKEGSITVNNLNVKYPDEVIDKEAEQELLLSHDRIVFQYPWYWYNMPPLLRKWQDTVLEYGFAFGPGGTKLSGKDYVVATSIGGPEVSYQAGGYNTFTVSEFLKPMQQTANLAGMNFLPAFKIHSAVVISDEDLEKSAEDYVKHITDPELDPQVELKRILKEMQETGNEL